MYLLSSEVQTCNVRSSTQAISHKHCNVLCIFIGHININSEMNIALLDCLHFHYIALSLFFVTFYKMTMQCNLVRNLAIVLPPSHLNLFVPQSFILSIYIYLNSWSFCPVWFLWFQLCDPNSIATEHFISAKPINQLLPNIPWEPYRTPYINPTRLELTLYGKYCDSLTVDWEEG